MTVSRLSHLCLVVLVLARSTLGTFPYPYPQFQPSLPLTTHLIYNVPIDGRAADFAGYSYFTKDLVGSGGQSEVVFVTGPNSGAQMNDEVAAMKDQLGSLAPTPGSTEISATDAPNSENQQNPSDDSKEVKASEENSDVSTPATLVPTEAKETSTSAPKAGVDQGLINGQVIPDQTFGFRAPYPILRLRGSSSFYPQTVGAFPGYEPFDYFKSKFDPFYERYGSYQTLYNPFYSAIDDYYNRLSPLSYSNPILDSQFFTPAVNNFIPGGSLPTFPESQGSQEIKPQIGTEEVGVTNSQKPDTEEVVKNSAAGESPVTDGADSSSEKKPESSTTSEQSSEGSSTPVLIAISSTEESTTTGASSTENDTVAVETAA